MKRALVILLAALAIAYVGFGLWVRSRRADRTAPVAGEIRGAWHVHTTRSDGRGSLDEVVRAARQAGLQFVVVTDHNVVTPEEAGYRDGVLVIQGTEISSKFGHVVALGVSRAPAKQERTGQDPFDLVQRLGGRAVLAHPAHARRPYSGPWSPVRWAGVELVSNDTFWGSTVADARVARFLWALAALPWDRAQAVLALYEPPTREGALADGADRQRPQSFLCSADAHGWPSYRAAFEAFSMHVPVTLTGQAGADTARVLDALLDGRGTCVFDGVAPGWGAALERRDAGEAPAIVLRAPRAPDGLRVLHDGRQVQLESVTAGPDGAVPVCGGTAPLACAPGRWRVEATIDGRPWLFTNPVGIE